MNRLTTEASLSEVHQSVDTTNLSKPKWRRILSYFGPAYLVSVGYMDPGNWATDLQGGSQFGYKLIWVLLMSNLMALLLQMLSARLGIVRGRDLAQANRETYPKSINFVLYLLAEVAIAATDLAEVLGMAIGIQLLTGMPLLWAVLITVFDTFLLLLLQRLGMRKMEAFIICLIAIIGISFLVEIILAKPNLSEVVTGFVPSIPNTQALFIATGIIGATIMPHNLYLHSALVQTRKISRSKSGIKRALKLNFIDSVVALNAAFFVNAAILILAAAVFFKAGRSDVAEIKEAHKLLNFFLGTHIAPILFAVALIAAGQSSTITGTLAGQIVMEGYLRIRINPWVRRLLTRVIAIIPAVLVIVVNGEENIDDLLVLSQVVLSLQLGFAIVPLIHFVSDKKTMGEFTIGPFVQVLSWCVTAVLVYLNLRMLYEKGGEYFAASDNVFWKLIILVSALLFVGLLAVTVFYPLWRRRPSGLSARVHKEQPSSLGATALPHYRKVAAALDFSERDENILAHAVAQAGEGATVILIHIVESVSAQMLEENSDDFETQKDKEKLEAYAEEIRKQNLNAETVLGFRYRTKEIARLVNESGADLLIIGAHGHRGVKDWLYGQTIDAVRHKLKIPVLIV
ncbi:Nramp family divalent metal transporter [Flavisolibacter ginsenosidimutans]|uniref:Divalent metal cation transporter MntH n=1 Tax=Flavisolibacter ginsenosidimutans TaxID=661481 RepID=A0A5B8UIZ6_9BACT|nr:Nramp family divalent metal transporter [Flavisolibacter ginsenosidimutans]QEC56372.1 iron/manganese transporter [Flavisolibacter ginsenosidimutans]